MSLEGEKAPEEVVVVDDEEGLVVLLTDILTVDMGAKVRGFTDPTAALDYFVRGQGSPWPSILITDLNMPGMDGVELVEKVRKVHPRVRVIGTSSSKPSEAGVAKFIGLIGGPSHFIGKPFEDIDMVVERVKAAIAEGKTDNQAA